MNSLPQHQHGETTGADIERFKMVANLCTGNVLDIGCGRGELKQYLPKDCTYLGINPEPIGDAEWGDVYYLISLGKQFDTVTLLEVLEHLQDPLKALIEIKRVLKGTLILSVPNPYNLNQIFSVLKNKTNCIDPDHISMFGDNEIRSLCYHAGYKTVIPVRFYTKIPGLNWLSPFRSCFGEWSIYIVRVK